MSKTVKDFKGVKCKTPEILKENLARRNNNTKDNLLSNIHEIGLQYSTPTPGNGNCFFEAVSDQLKRLGLPLQNASDLRSKVIAFCKENPILKRDDGDVDIKNFVEGDLCEYLDRMSNDGEWADHVMVVYMAEYLKRDIFIVTSSPNADPDKNILWITSGNNGDDPLLLGHVWEYHYQSLMPIQGIAMDFETKIEKLNGVYSKLLQELADTKKYGEDLQKELSTDFKDFWNVINASKRDLARMDCEIVVAGEVSSGKTTLVNCLLGQEFNDLLEVKLLASTGCITRIHNKSKKHRVEIRDKNEKQLRTMVLENFKSFQEKELKTLREAYFVDAYLPVSLLKGHVILVDTPGIGETNQRDEMLLKFLPHAVAFIFVINARNAGGFADDRIGKILREVSAKTEDMPCFDRSDAMFLTNQWDSVEDALFRAKDKEKEVNEAWEIIKSQIMEKFDVPSSDNIFQISLREVYERKETKYKKEYDRFYEKLEKTIKKNENKRVDFYLKYIKDFYGKAHKKNKARLRQSKTNEDGLKNQLKKTEKQIESIEGKMEQVKSDMIQCREDSVKELSSLLKKCLEDNKDNILNPEGEESMKDVSFHNIPKEVFRRVETYLGKWFKTNDVEQIMSKANETFRTETTKIVEEINEIASDLGVITVFGTVPIVNNVHSVLTMRNVVMSTAGGVVIGLGAAVISASLAVGLVSGGVVATGLFIFRKKIGIETRSWLEDQSYRKAVKLVIAENIPEKYIGKEFDKTISSICDTLIPDEIKRLKKEQKETKSKKKEIRSKRKLYEHLDKIFNDIEKDLEELKSM